MLRDLAVDVVLGTPNTGAVRLCRWPDYPEPIVGSHGRSRGQIWVERAGFWRAAPDAPTGRARARATTDTPDAPPPHRHNKQQHV